MHEFSLAQGLHNQLVELAGQHDVKKVLKAEISVGKNSGIVLESFLFGFNVVQEQSDVTKGMELIVTEDDSNDLILQRVELE